MSSYAYREAFAESFSLAVSSDILSIAYGVHEAAGYEMALRADRYQGLKMAALPPTATTPAIPEEQVRIFHVPSLDFSSTEHEIPASERSAVELCGFGGGPVAGATKFFPGRVDAASGSSSGDLVSDEL